MNQIETGDIFRGAYLLCKGANLIESKLEGRREVTFVIEKEDISAEDMRYRTGQALVNPLQLKETLNLLRDIIFTTSKNRNQNRRINGQDTTRRNRSIK